MINPSPKEQEFLEEMLDVKRQIYLADSWKRKNDLRKCLANMEREWYACMRFKREAKRKTN